MTPEDFELISEIERKRNDNNLNWMAILRIALEFAPDQTRAVLKHVMRTDRQITNITEALIDDEDSKS